MYVYIYIYIYIDTQVIPHRAPAGWSDISMLSTDSEIGSGTGPACCIDTYIS